MLNLDLDSRVSEVVGKPKMPVILCIGSDRVTGDSLGPLVGHILSTLNIPAFVYGNLARPVTAVNLLDTLAEIKRHHLGSKIIAIDSSVGSCGEIGLIRAFRGGIAPGAALGKKLPTVGDVGITATVTNSPHKNLYSVRLGFVYSLAEKIANALIFTLCDAKFELA